MEGAVRITVVEAGQRRLIHSRLRFGRGDLLLVIGVVIRVPSRGRNEGEQGRPVGGEHAAPCSAAIAHVGLARSDRG